MGRAGEDRFVSEFYSHSRLHHLSTWGVQFKELVNRWRSERGPERPIETTKGQVHRGVKGHSPLKGSGPSELKGDTHKEFKGRVELRSLKRRGLLDSGPSGYEGGALYMHVDMDCFFVAVGLRSRPELVGLPVVVTHSKGQNGPAPRPDSDIQWEKDYYRAKNPTLQQQGQKAKSGSGDAFNSMAEIASCSYEARKFGVKNGMFMGAAKKLCPDLHPIPYDFDGYNQVSLSLYETVARYTLDIEATSCDEMYIDCLPVLTATGVGPEEFAAHLRAEIKEKTGCIASAGMGENLLLARLATRKAKPNGHYWVRSEEVEHFMEDLPAKDLPGIGRKQSQKLSILSVQTCADLLRVPLPRLRAEFGPKLASQLVENARGHDSRPLRVRQERQSVSAEINYGIRFKEAAEAIKFLGELSTEVCDRMKRARVKGRTITLKLKVRKDGAPVESAKFMGHGICDSLSKSVNLPLLTDDPRIIHKECIRLYEPLQLDYKDIRGVGIQMQKLMSPEDAAAAERTRPTKTLLSFVQSGGPYKDPFEGVIPKVKSTAKSTPKKSSVYSTKGKRSMPPLPSFPGFVTSPPKKQKLNKAAQLNEVVDECEVIVIDSSAHESTLQEDPQRLTSAAEGHPRNSEKHNLDSSAEPPFLSPIIDINKERTGAELGGRRSEPKTKLPSSVDRSSDSPTAMQIDSPIRELTSLDAAGVSENLSGDVIFIGSASPSPSAAKTNRMDMQPQQTRRGQGRPRRLLTSTPAPKQRMSRSKTKQSRSKPKHNVGGKVCVLPSHPTQLAQTEPTVVEVTAPRTEHHPTKNGSNSNTVRQGESRPAEQTKGSGKPAAAEGGPTPVGEPDLCGARKESDVRHLLARWLNESPQPVAADTDRVSGYMTKLIKAKNLELVGRLLPHLFLLIDSKDSENWMKCFEEICDRVQTVVQHHHGAPLKLPDFCRSRVGLP